MATFFLSRFKRLIRSDEESPLPKASQRNSETTGKQGRKRRQIAILTDSSVKAVFQKEIMQVSQKRQEKAQKLEHCRRTVGKLENYIFCSLYFLTTDFYHNYGFLP